MASTKPDLQYLELARSIVARSRGTGDSDEDLAFKIGIALTMAANMSYQYGLMDGSHNGSNGSVFDGDDGEGEEDEGGQKIS